MLELLPFFRSLFAVSKNAAKSTVRPLSSCLCEYKRKKRKRMKVKRKAIGGERKGEGGEFEHGVLEGRKLASLFSLFLRVLSRAFESRNGASRDAHLELGENKSKEEEKERGKLKTKKLRAGETVSPRKRKWRESEEEVEKTAAAAAVNG